MNYTSSLSDQELHILSRQNGVFICRYHIKTRVMERLYDNPELRYGIKRRQENVPEAFVAEGRVSADTQASYLAMFESIFQGIPTGSMDVKLFSSSGELRWHHADYSLVLDDDKTPQYALITFFDNTESRELELAAEKWRTSLSALLSEASLYAEVNLTQNVVELLTSDEDPINIAAPTMTLDDVTHKGLFGTVSKETLAEYQAFFSRQRFLGLFVEKVCDDKFDYCVTPENEAPRWVRASVRLFKSPHSGDIMTSISFTRLESHQKDLESLTHKAYHDPLTGLLNREGFDLGTEEALAAYNPDLTTALFMIDLDNFKQINDRLGHQVGDMVLCRVAETLRTTFRAEDIIGRLGGDEFIVLLKARVSQHHLERKALELLTTVKLQHEGLQLPVSVSIGVVFGRSRQFFDRLYRMADIALYTSKKAGKCCFHIINSDTNEEQTSKRLDAEAGLVTLQELLQPTEMRQMIISRTPYEALLENIPGGVVSLELRRESFKVINCNDWFYQYLGYPRAELAPLLDENPICVAHPDDRQGLLASFQRILDGQDEIHTVFRVQTKSGDYKYLSLRASLTERQPDLVIMHGIHTDVDGMMFVQQELEQSRKKLQHMIDSIPGGIALFELTDIKKTYLYGDWMLRVSGFSHEELQAIAEYDDHRFVYPEDLPLVADFFQRFRNGENNASVSVRLLTKDKEPLPIHIKASVIERTPNKISVYAIFLTD